MAALSILERFRAKYEVDPTSGCWNWAASLYANGYGQFWNGERTEQAHRVAYRLFVGEIPDGQEIDHACDNRRCVRPASDHVRPLSHQDNMRRSQALCGINARKTNCHRGHPLSGPNLCVTKVGARQCRTCFRIRAAEARKRAA